MTESASNNQLEWMLERARDDRLEMNRKLDQLIDDGRDLREQYGELDRNVDQLANTLRINSARLDKLEKLPELLVDAANLVQVHQSLINMAKRWGLRIVLFLMLSVIFGASTVMKVVDWITKLIVRS